MAPINFKNPYFNSQKIAAGESCTELSTNALPKPISSTELNPLRGSSDAFKGSFLSFELPVRENLSTEPLTFKEVKEPALESKYTNTGAVESITESLNDMGLTWGDVASTGTNMAPLGIGESYETLCYAAGRDLITGDEYSKAEIALGVTFMAIGADTAISGTMVIKTIKSLQKGVDLADIALPKPVKEAIASFLEKHPEIMSRLGIDPEQIKINRSNADIPTKAPDANTAISPDADIPRIPFGGKTISDILSEYPPPININPSEWRTRGLEIAKAGYSKVNFKKTFKEGDRSFKVEQYRHEDVSQKYPDSWRINVTEGKKDYVAIKPAPSSNPEKIVRIDGQEYELVEKRVSPGVNSWRAAENAENDGKATAEQIDMLERGHFGQK